MTRICNAFVLYEDGIWEQPSFYVPEGRTDEDIRHALYKRFGRDVIHITEIADDPDAPIDNIDTLTWEG